MQQQPQIQMQRQQMQQMQQMQQQPQMQQPQQNQLLDHYAQIKLQMAHEITQAYQGRVTVEQVMNMPIDAVQRLYHEMKNYQIEMQKQYQNNNAQNNTHIQQQQPQHVIHAITENPIHIMLVLINQYPQLETWLKSQTCYSIVTTSPTHAIECLNQLMQQQPPVIQAIASIQQQLSQRRSISQILNQNNSNNSIRPIENKKNINNSMSRKRKLDTTMDSNNCAKKRKLSHKENKKKLQCLSKENKQKKKRKKKRKKYKQKNKKLTERIEIIETKLDIWECKSEKLNPMNLDELNELKIKMQNKIKLIERAEKKIMDNTYKCLACVDNVKNISFDSCTHMALCDKCEAALEVKRCPICQTPYKNVKKINF